MCLGVNKGTPLSLLLIGLPRDPRLFLCDARPPSPLGGWTAARAYVVGGWCNEDFCDTLVCPILAWYMSEYDFLRGVGRVLVGEVGCFGDVVRGVDRGASSFGWETKRVK